MWWNTNRERIFRQKKLSLPGFEPRSPGWQPGMLATEPQHHIVIYQNIWVVIQILCLMWFHLSQTGNSNFTSSFLDLWMILECIAVILLFQLVWKLSKSTEFFNKSWCFYKAKTNFVMLFSAIGFAIAIYYL